MGLTQVNTSSHLGHSYHVGRNTDKALQAKNPVVAVSHVARANVCIHFAGRLAQEPPDRLNECALRFANHNLLTKSQYLVS